MHSDKKRCADTLSLSRQAEQNRAEERVSIDTKKGSKYNKSNEKRGGGIQLKKRKWKFRIAGGAVTLLGIYLMAVGYGETITLTIATVVLIFGIAIWSMATPENYITISLLVVITALGGIEIIKLLGSFITIKFTVCFSILITTYCNCG